MKCKILFFGETQKNINLSSSDLAQRVVKVKLYHSLNKFSIQQTDDIFLIFSQKIGFDISCKLSKPIFWEK